MNYQTKNTLVFLGRLVPALLLLYYIILLVALYAKSNFVLKILIRKDIDASNTSETAIIELENWKKTAWIAVVVLLLALGLTGFHVIAIIYLVLTILYIIYMFAKVLLTGYKSV